MSTLKEVARVAHVSISTVSRVFSGNITVKEETKRKILAIANELDYHPNALGQYLKMHQTKSIGVLVPDIRNPIFPILVRGIEDMAQKNGFSIILINTDESGENQKNSINLLRSLWVAGLIVATGKPDGFLEKGTLLFRDIPVVGVVRKVDPHIDCILADNAGGIDQAIDYLLAKGKKKICICKGPDSNTPYRERFEAFRKKLEPLGLYDPELVVEITPFGMTSRSNMAAEEDIGYRQLKDYFSKGVDVDAILAANDITAMKCIRLAAEWNLRIPQDISIIGFDDVDLSSMMVPSLTTVSQPFYEMGKAVVKRLLERIVSGNTLPVSENRFPTKLIKRETA